LPYFSNLLVPLPLFNLDSQITPIIGYWESDKVFVDQLKMMLFPRTTNQLSLNSSVNLSSDASLTFMAGSGSYRSLLAVKSVWQHYAPTRDVLGLLEVFRRMVNESIRIGLANDVSSLRKLSLLSYNQLAHYDSPSYYKLCAISRAAGILASRKKSPQERILH
jgi:hypothetical protein